MRVSQRKRLLSAIVSAGTVALLTIGMIIVWHGRFSQSDTFSVIGAGLGAGVVGWWFQR